MKMYVGVTDYDWFCLLKERQPEEINFWQPTSGRNFRAIQEGELFLFKLHYPRNFIVGGGVFTRQVTTNIMPITGRNSSIYRIESSNNQHSIY